MRREWSRRGPERGSMTRSNVAPWKAMESPQSTPCPTGFGVSWDERTWREECASFPRSIAQTKDVDRPISLMASDMARASRGSQIRTLLRIGKFPRRRFR